MSNFQGVGIRTRSSERRKTFFCFLWMPGHLLLGGFLYLPLLSCGLWFRRVVVAVLAEGIEHCLETGVGNHQAYLFFFAFGEQGHEANKMQRV